jgi:hypothetical protein
MQLRETLSKAVVAAVLVLAVVPLSSAARASPVDVSYTVSGSPGDWLIDFSITNNLEADFDIYFFGIQLPSPDPVMVYYPSHWEAAPPVFNPWPPTFVTPTEPWPISQTYNTLWCVPGCTDFAQGIAPDQTLSGFEAIDSGSTRPSSLPWFLFAHSDDITYAGNGCDYLCQSVEPGFIGTATIPLPGTLPLLISGLGALALLDRRRRRKAQASP